MPDQDQSAPERTEGERRTRRFVATFVIFSLSVAGLVGFAKWREIHQMADIWQAKKAEAENAASPPDNIPEDSAPKNNE